MRQINNLVILVLAFVLPSIAFCNMTVYAPGSLKDDFGNRPINYSIANFGHTPYGRTLIAPVILADPVLACGPIAPVNPNKFHDAPFVVVKRGNCTFVTKVKYAQLIGAKMVIIVDNRDEHTTEMVMADDGHAQDIKIPSIFVTEYDGNKLINHLNHTDPEKQNVVLTIKFDTIQRDHVNYTFWLSTGNRMSFQLVKHFRQYHEKLGDLVTFTPHYAIWRSIYTTNTEIPDCVSGGRYCAVDPDGDLPGTGRDVVQEDLRQICIFRNDPKHWWNYMEQFDNECANYAELTSCSKKLQEKLNIDNKAIEQCVTDSYSGSDIQKSDNTILAEERNALLKNGVLFWPSVSINNQQYRGNLDGDDIFEAVCSDFQDPPTMCYEALGIEQPSNKGGANVTTIILVVILVLFVFFLFMILVYKRMVRRELQKEMSTQVNQMVSQYIAFYETREKTRKDDNA